MPSTKRRSPRRFRRPKPRPARLAKAAGAELGSLKTLTAHSSSAGGYNEYGNYNQYAYRALQMARRAQGNDEDGSDDETEAMGVEPGPVKITVTVMAAFDLKRGK